MKRLLSIALCLVLVIALCSACSAKVDLDLGANDEPPAEQPPAEQPPEEPPTQDDGPDDSYADVELTLAGLKKAAQAAGHSTEPGTFSSAERDIPDPWAGFWMAPASGSIFYNNIDHGNVLVMEFATEADAKTYAEFRRGEVMNADIFTFEKFYVEFFPLEGTDAGAMERELIKTLFMDGRAASVGTDPTEPPEVMEYGYNQFPIDVDMSGVSMAAIKAAAGQMDCYDITDNFSYSLFVSVEYVDGFDMMYIYGGGFSSLSVIEFANAQDAATYMDDRGDFFSFVYGDRFVVELLVSDSHIDQAVSDLQAMFAAAAAVN